MTDPRTDDDLVGARPIAGAPFGWEATVDLARPLEPGQREALRRIWRRDGLILFRDQSLAMERQIDVCEIFGPVLRGAIDNYLVSNVEKGGLLGKAELLFHNDIPYVPKPYIGGSLHALEVSEGAAATRFASAMRAWETLPDALRSRVERLKGLQVRGRMLGRRTRIADLEPGDVCAVHPLVGRQEETGRPYIFANMDMTACITTLDEVESDAVIEELFARLYDPSNVYEHIWRRGDFIVWDNLAVQHARSPTGDAPRTLQRVTIAELGYWEQVPADLPLFRALQEMDNPAD